MNFVILDLEWNSAYSSKLHRYINEIIEFGAVKVNDKFQVLDKFSMLVKPQVCKKLCSHVVSMTHITNAEVFDCDNSFLYVLREFQDFCGDSILLTWGTLDVLTLIDNYSYYTGQSKLPFLKKYCNLQEYCEKALGVYDPSAQLGLQNCADMINISSEELKLHRAYADAELSLKCMEKLYREDRFGKSVDTANDEFYKKITFKNRKITDLSNPLVDVSELEFDCDKCGAKTERYTAYRIKNKSFLAEYFCPECCNEFTGRLSLKLKYDGVTVTKKIVDIVPEN